MSQAVTYKFEKIRLKENTLRFNRNSILFFLFLLFLGSNVLAFTPLSGVAQILTIVYVPFVFLAGVFYYYSKVMVQKKLTVVDLLASFFFILPIYTAMQANSAFDFPILKGLLQAGAKQFIIFSSLFVYYLLRSGSFTMEEFNRGTLYMTWFCLGLYILTVFTVNPALYRDTEFVGFNPAKGGYVWKFNPGFLLYGIVFYFLHFMMKRNYLSLFAFTGLLAYILFVQKGRIHIFTSVGTVLLYSFIVMPKKRWTFSLIPMVIFLAMMLFIAWMIDPKVLGVLREMFGNFFLALLGFETGEGSADARLFEMNQAFDYLAKHPYRWIFGVGMMNREGWDRFFDNFYVTDIGIIGAVFVYGIVGTAMHYILYIPAFFWGFKVKNFKHNLIFHVTLCTALLNVLQSFFYGGFIWLPTTLVNSLAMMHFYYLQDMNIEHEKRIKAQNEPAPP